MRPHHRDRVRGWLLALSSAVLAAGITAVALRDVDGGLAGDEAGASSGKDGPSTDPPADPFDPTAAKERAGRHDGLDLDELRGVDAASRACLLGRPADTVRPDAPAESRHWRPDLNDDFDRIDSRWWTVRDHTLLDHDDAYLLAGNVTTRGGDLAISARREAAGGRDFTSGYVATDGKYSLPPTFQVQVRAKVPTRPGLWAAPLWLRPTDGSGGEIDLAETTHQPGERPTVHHSIHTSYGPDQQVAARRYPFAGIGDRTGTGWHTYVLRKTPGLMVMWVDGEVEAAFCTGSPGWYDSYYDVGKRWNLRINLQVGGWGGAPRADDDWSGDRATLLVDSVTTWVPAR
ncbi:glycoside hydrolase family 16 protein [Nocardioides panacisoli]|uniref:GH16 domain-containing protein n=1 Tax=Nocardioides panacisoli TaxID=627624 RepID=A0ABP7IHR5_9ACTN